MWGWWTTWLVPRINDNVIWLSLFLGHLLLQISNVISPWWSHWLHMAKEPLHHQQHAWMTPRLVTHLFVPKWISNNTYLSLFRGQSECLRRVTLHIAQILLMSPRHCCDQQTSWKDASVISVPKVSNYISHLSLFLGQVEWPHLLQKLPLMGWGSTCPQTK